MKRISAAAAAVVVTAMTVATTPAFSVPQGPASGSSPRTGQGAAPATGNKHHLGSQGPARLERVGKTTVPDSVATSASAKSFAPDSEFGPWLGRDEEVAGGGGGLALPRPTPSNRALQLAQNRRGWEGLDHADQRFAGGGNQFSLEPPDQGLCVGGVSPIDPAAGPEVVESVNDAITFYDGSSNQLAPILTLSEFYGLPPAIDRTTGRFGAFLTDPKCYFDVDTQRWFHSVLEIDLDPKTGDFTGPSYIYLAVSTTSEALGPYNIYRINTTDSTHPNCPCFGDQPLIGADKYGFYVSTAEYSLAESAFNGPQIYAMNKRALEAGTLGRVVHISNVQHDVRGRTTGTVQPAMSPDAVFETAAHGTEYFLSSFDCLPVDACPIAGGQFNEITTWALTNTQSLTTSSPHLRLSLKDVHSEVYGTPVPQHQKAGPRPLGELVGEPLPVVAANDSRMSQVVYAKGYLWSGLNTAVGPQTRDGIAYFIVRPAIKDGRVAGTIHNQGYVAAAQTYLSFPSVGVSPSGAGVIAMSAMGANLYPSAAQVHINASGVNGPVQIVRQGFRPEDGFTCYQAFVGDSHVCRWGDYSASVGTPDGSVYSATEFIGDNKRTFFANWSTFVWPTKP